MNSLDLWGGTVDRPSWKLTRDQGSVDARYQGEEGKLQVTKNLGYPAFNRHLWGTELPLPWVCRQQRTN